MQLTLFPSRLGTASPVSAGMAHNSLEWGIIGLFGHLLGKLALDVSRLPKNGYLCRLLLIGVQRKKSWVQTHVFRISSSADVVVEIVDLFFDFGEVDG